MSGLDDPGTEGKGRIIDTILDLTENTDERPLSSHRFSLHRNPDSN
jgi:hypothetical protein